MIREYYAEALKLESAMLINLFIRKIVLYNDKIEIYFNTPLRNDPDDDRGCSFFGELDPFREPHYIRMNVRRISSGLKCWRAKD